MNLNTWPDSEKRQIEDVFKRFLHGSLLLPHNFPDRQIIAMPYNPIPKNVGYELMIFMMCFTYGGTVSEQVLPALSGI